MRFRNSWNQLQYYKQCHVSRSAGDEEGPLPDRIHVSRSAHAKQYSLAIVREMLEPKKNPCRGNLRVDTCASLAQEFVALMIGWLPSQGHWADVSRLDPYRAFFLHSCFSRIFLHSCFSMLLFGVLAFPRPSPGHLCFSVLWPFLDHRLGAATHFQNIR